MTALNKKETMRNTTISIDYEYNDKRLVCCCTRDSQEDHTRRWNLLHDRDTEALSTYLKSHKRDRVLICHAVEKAEGQAFQRMGLDPSEWKWYDTYTIECIKQNCNNVDWPPVTKELRKTLYGLALPDLEQRYLGKEDRSEHKKEMRELIIRDEDLDEHIDAIMDYCAEDIDSLLQIADKQIQLYTDLFKWHLTISYSFKTLDKIPRGSLNFEELFIKLCRAPVILSKSAYKGIQMDNRVARLHDRAEFILSSFRENFNKTHGEIFSKTKKGVWRKDAKKLEELLLAIEAERRKTNPEFVWPKSERTGKCKTDKDTLDKEPFKSIPLIKDLKKIEKFRSSFQNLKNFKFEENNIHSNPCHHMFGTQTGRCAGKPSDGFVPLMNHVFRVMMNPRRPGDKLVSIDFTAQENALAGAWSNDPQFKYCYSQKDFYIAAGQRFGRIPEGATKKSHPFQREECKITCLSKNYGQGVSALALRLNIPQEEAQKLSDLYNETFAKYYSKRRDLTNLVKNKGYHCFMFFLPDGMPYIQWTSDKGFLADVDKASQCDEKTSAWEIDRANLQTKRLTSLLNIPIQGTGSSILREIIQKLNKENFDIVCTIHDEAVLNIPAEDNFDERVARVKEIFSEAFHEFYPDDFIKVGEPEVREYDGKIISHEAMDNATWQELINMGIFKEDEIELA